MLRRKPEKVASGRSECGAAKCKIDSCGQQLIEFACFGKDSKLPFQAYALSNTPTFSFQLGKGMIMMTFLLQ